MFLSVQHVYKDTDSKLLFYCIFEKKIKFHKADTFIINSASMGHYLGWVLYLLTLSTLCSLSQVLSSPGQASPYQLTCHEKLSSTSRLSRSIGGSQGVSSTVGFSHGGDRQSSAAIAKGDLHAGQSGSRNHLAIPKPAHLRNWETCGPNTAHFYV